MITSYAALKTAIADWTHRADLTSAIPDFIALAEQRMNLDLRARDMEITATLATVADTSTVATPADMLELRRLTLVSSPNSVLDYMPPEKAMGWYSSDDTGKPVNYNVIGANFQLFPTPDAIYSLLCLYRQKLTALSDGVQTNWLITKYPYLYLYASLCSTTPWMEDDARIPMWEQQYKLMLDQINKADWYSGANMRVRPA